MSAPEEKDTSNPNIPLNYRAIVFCFLMGTAWSPFVGLMRFRLFAAPESWYVVYGWLFVASFILLPNWSFFLVRRYNPLAAIGGITFILILLLGLLCPAL